MDPAQSECYATAQVQLRELFHEISKRGFVGAAELQHSLLPFAAGDVRRDVLELIDDLTRRRAALDEHEFIRAMWRKMYLPHMLFAAKLSGCRENNVERGSSGEMVNVPFAHVVVTIKRRGQMKQFASYYKSRGISGADHLTSVSAMDATSPSPGKQNLRISSPKQATIDPAEKASTPSNLSVEDLRHRRSACYDVVVCVYDGADRALKTSVIRARVRQANLRGCSSLYCLLLSPDDGAFAIGSSYFAEIAQQEFHTALDRYNATESGARFPVRPVKSSLPIDAAIPSLLLAKLDDLGLRNVTAAAGRSGKFGVSTGRKLHLWKSPEPLRVFANESGKGGMSSLLLVDGEDFQPEQYDEVEMNAECDCLGLLGGNKLLGRSKTIVDLSSVSHIAISDSLVFAQTTSGDLFSWQRSASNSNAGSGTSSTTPIAPPPGAEVQSNAYLSKVPIEFPSSSERVRRISCGRRHVIVVTSAGNVYGWGSNELGQLGLGDDKDLLDREIVTPTRISYQTPRGSGSAEATFEEVTVVDVGSGDDHSLLLTEEGDILVCGSHWYGQLGLGPICDGASSALVDGCSYVFTQLNLNTSSQTRAYLIAAQGDSSVAVTTSGDVYQWGKCVPSGISSVCGLVSRWRPERVVELSTLSSNAAESTLPLWHGIAISHGILALTRHAST